MQILSEKLKELEFPAHVFRLDNGLTLIHQYLDGNPAAVADVWIRAGASAEPESWCGMAHFLEHMIFKGTKRTPPGVFDWIIENTGGMANAATSHDYTHFFLTTAASSLPDTLPYLGDILLHAEIPDDEFLRERHVVLEELRSCYDDPDWLAYQVLCQSLYQSHPYGRSILGEEEQLLQHSPNQMRCFHKTHYQPENMTVVIVGGVEQELALSLVNQSFTEFSIRSECPAIKTTPEPPLREIRRTQLDLPRLAQARLLMAWSAPNNSIQGNVPLADAFTLDVLSVLLAGGRCARLIRDLVEEKQLALDIGSDFSLQKDATLFTINAWLEAQYLEPVEALIQQQIERLQTEKVTSAELSRCKRLLCNDYAFSTETPSQLAGLYGYYHTIAQAELAVTYPYYIQQLTPEDVQRVARRYLNPEVYAVTVVKPA